MLTPETAEMLRAVGEGIVLVATVVMGHREIKRRRNRAPLSIASEDEQDDSSDRRTGVRRSEFSALMRRVDSMVAKVEGLIELVADHQNRLDESDAQRRDFLLGLRELTTAVNEMRSEMRKQLRGEA